MDVCAFDERHKDKAASNANDVKFIFFMYRSFPVLLINFKNSGSNLDITQSLTVFYEFILIKFNIQLIKS